MLRSEIFFGRIRACKISQPGVAISPAALYNKFDILHQRQCGRKGPLRVRRIDEQGNGDEPRVDQHRVYQGICPSAKAGHWETEKTACGR